MCYAFRCYSAGCAPISRNAGFAWTARTISRIWRRRNGWSEDRRPWLATSFGVSVRGRYRLDKTCLQWIEVGCRSGDRVVHIRLVGILQWYICYELPYTRSRIYNLTKTQTDTDVVFHICTRRTDHDLLKILLTVIYTFASTWDTVQDLRSTDQPSEFVYARTMKIRGRSTREIFFLFCFSRNGGNILSDDDSRRLFTVRTRQQLNQENDCVDSCTKLIFVSHLLLLLLLLLALLLFFCRFREDSVVAVVLVPPPSQPSLLPFRPFALEKVLVRNRTRRKSHALFSTSNILQFEIPLQWRAVSRLGFAAIILCLSC